MKLDRTRKSLVLDLKPQKAGSADRFASCAESAPSFGQARSNPFVGIEGILSIAIVSVGEFENGPSAYDGARWLVVRLRRRSL
jgi:hypothetical protein